MVKAPSSWTGGRPFLVLKKSAGRKRGIDVLTGNVMVARIVAEMVKSSFGPRSMDKMLIDALGDVKVTSDGATILKEIDVQHPVAKMMAEAAKSVDDEVGDGTTTTVLLASELLKRAEDLLRQNVHPTVIVEGYRKAGDEAIKLLNEICVQVDMNDFETLQKIAITSLQSKIVGIAKRHLANLAVEAIAQIVEKRGDKFFADSDQILIVKREGGSLQDSQLIRGIIEIQSVVHPEMPKRVEKAKIALLNSHFIIVHPGFGHEIRIRDPFQMKAFLDEEKRMLKEMVDKVKASGANVLICQQNIDDAAQQFLARENIMALKKVSEKDMEKLARATGGRIVVDIKDLKESDLGYAELVEERRIEYKIGQNRLVFIERCKDPKSVSVLIRGGTEKIVDEAERSLRDALSVISDVVRKNKIVPGGGSIEIEIAKELRNYAVKVGGREQLAINAYADSLEIIPKTLIENAGLDVVDTLASLRAAHEKPGGMWMGIDVFQRKISFMNDVGVIEPLIVKEQAIKTATEISMVILRIDDAITSRARATT